MPKYPFYQDVKQTIWSRHKFEIEAEDHDRALAKLETMANQQVADSLDLNILHGGCEFIYETRAAIFPEANRDKSTLEIHSDDGTLLFENGETNICY